MIKVATEPGGDIIPDPVNLIIVAGSIPTKSKLSTIVNCHKGTTRD